ncbi:MAG: hypothetical protein WBM80_02435 [Woeseiaceae bacterium]
MNHAIKTRIFAGIAATTFFAALVAGCATAGTSTLSDAALSGDPDAMWTEGQDLARKGEHKIKKGEQRMVDGRRQIRDGEARICDGSERVAQSRRDYESAVTSAGDAKTPKVVSDEAKRLKAIGKRWEDALDTIRAGNLLVENGNKNIETGRAEVREGRLMIESGSILMRNSERTRRGDELLPIINRLGSTSEQ